MSSILIPIDFSLPCHNAYRFGLHLAEAFQLDVVLAHYSMGSIDPGQPLTFGGDGSIHSSKVERLQGFAHSTAEGIDYPLAEPAKSVNVTYESEIVFSVSAAIIARAAQSDIAMIVMAPRSSKKLLGKWLGSTSTTVSESSNRPVYLVPEDARFRPLKKIVVANNHVSAETYPLWQIEGLADLFKASVHFVHVEWPRQYGPKKRTLTWSLLSTTSATGGAPSCTPPLRRILRYGPSGPFWYCIPKTPIPPRYGHQTVTDHFTSDATAYTSKPRKLSTS